MTIDSIDNLTERIEQVLAQLTLDEKAALTVGRDSWTTVPVERLGVPSVRVSDGPTGLRKVRDTRRMDLENNAPATCFPTASALAASWDVNLVRQVGFAIGSEAQAENVQVLLAPGLNLKRSPLCGRNFEYFSEDPVLTGELAAAYVNGLQANGVGGCLKHFVANESETDRMIVSSEVDERTLRELYLRAFEIAVEKSQPWTMMCGYNRVNGVYCAENKWLLTQVLVNEWGYPGIVMSDWFAVNDRAAGIEAGLHLQMPHGPTAPGLAAAVREGRLAESRLDEVLRPLLRFIFLADSQRQPDPQADYAAHHRLARRAAGESAVLLKNEGGLLPLSGADLHRIALMGALAKQPRFQGAGSSQVTPAQIVENCHDQLELLLGDEGEVSFAPGYTAEGDADPGLLAQATALAQAASIAVLVVGLPGAYEEEGRDRTHMDLPPGHNALVEAVLAVQPKTVVVLVNGSAVRLPWADRAPAIVEAWLGGQAGGGAIGDVLLGHVNPSGKLAESFPIRLEDTPAYLNFPDDGMGHVSFAEGLFTGYRWYDAREIEPRFPFGHGLSYTSFEYSGLVVSEAQVSDGGTLDLSLRVRNTGERTGQEVVQVYVAERRPRLPRPRQELKAFAKVALEPGEEKEVRFSLGRRDLAYFDPNARTWTVAGGEYELRVGSSSRDIRLRARATLAGDAASRGPFSRLTPIRDWLRHEGSREVVTRSLGRLFKAFAVPEEAAAAMASQAIASDDGGSAGFYGDMPISKHIMFGVLSEAEVQALIEAANAGK